MAKTGFLYHGSPNKYEKLKPNQAYDWGYEEGCQYALYATSERNIALAFALGTVADNDGECCRVLDKQYGEPLRMIFWKGHPCIGGKGYLYKISSEGFTFASGTQWIIDKEIVPIEIVEIEVDDYGHLWRYATEIEKEEILKEYQDSGSDKTLEDTSRV